MKKIILFAIAILLSFNTFSQIVLPKRYSDSSEDSPEKEVVIIRKTDTILAISDTLKETPKLFASISRPFMSIQGKTEIDKDIASRRQTNFRLSQMNHDKLWLKAEIVDADLNLQSGEGRRFLLSDSTNLISYCSIDISEVCYIRLQYSVEGKNIEREIAYNKDNRIIYHCYYTNYTQENGYRVVITDYQTFDNKSLFKYNGKHFKRVRYLFNHNGTLEGCDVLDESGNIIVSLLSRNDSWKTIPSYDEYYRIEKEKIYKNDTLKTIERYKYDDKGKIIEDLYIEVIGDTLFHLQITPTYKYERWFDEYTIDSIDANGHVTYSATRGVYDGINRRNKNGYHYLRKIYDYRGYPQCYKVSTKFYVDTLYSDGTRIHRCIRHIEEEFHKDSVYLCKEYNKDGVYVGGLKFYQKIMKGTLSDDYASYDELKSTLKSNDAYKSGIVVPITPNGSEIINDGDVDDFDNISANAMAVSVTGERASRLGLKDNDIIAQWGNWYNYIRVGMLIKGGSSKVYSDLNRLWLQTILTQKKEKEIIVLRQEADSIQKVRIHLPIGNLDELQFTLIPIKVNKRIDSLLYEFKGSDHSTTFIPLLIPKNPYLHKPAILYGLGSHPSGFYTYTRPSPDNEWYYNRKFTYYGAYEDSRIIRIGNVANDDPSYFLDSFNYTAWLTHDSYDVEREEDVSKYYNIRQVKIPKSDTSILYGSSFTNWETSYLKKEQEEIDLPVLADTSEMNQLGSEITPDKILEYAICYNNENGFDLWKKWRPKNNVQLEDVFYKYEKNAKKSYIIPLDSTNIKQTMSVVSLVQYMKLKDNAQEWKLLDEKHNGYYDRYGRWCEGKDYYIFVRYDTLSKYSLDYIKDNIESIKGTQIFIYDRKNRKAAYIEK